ncbi:MAG: hypothetical protein F2780_10305, partial [Actinobacteria bacterium]|nr:hypothetical protein [Actinomycetota bacterium]
MSTNRKSRHSSFRHSSLHRFSAIAAAVVLSSIVGACSGDDASSTSVAETVASTDVATTVPTTDAAVPETEAPMAAIDQIVAPEATTVTDLLALDRPAIIAHAGGDFDWPHSMMYAFTQAALNGA